MNISDKEIEIHTIIEDELNKPLVVTEMLSEIKFMKVN